MTNDTISRKEVIDLVENSYYNLAESAEDVDSMIEDVEALPSADRPSGEWKSARASIHPYGYDVKCSVCGHRMGSSFGYKFCPMCGCRMKGADDD